VMRDIERTSKFKQDYKRAKKSDPSLDADLIPLLKLLASDECLPERLCDHSLSGKWKGYRDCHAKPDLVLIYEKREGVLALVRLGSHSDLFG
jgi:mRNA interferase YafQ